MFTRNFLYHPRLGTGWSVKTNQFQTYPKPAPLTEKEQQAIVSVIQKAQELDLTEQQRVGYVHQSQILPSTRHFMRYETMLNCVAHTCQSFVVMCRNIGRKNCFNILFRILLLLVLYRRSFFAFIPKNNG